MQNEIWIQACRFPRYEVSASGLVRDRETGQLRRVWRHSGLRGTLKVTLYTTSGQKVHVFVHRLVLESFQPAPGPGLQVNHINGDPQDNRLENLEWATPSDNTRHAYRHGLKTACGPRPVLSVCAAGVETIYTSVTEAARATGAPRRSISHALNGRQNTCRGMEWRYLK